MKLLSRLAAVVTVTATVTAILGGPAQANTNGTNYIHNDSGVGLGIIHLYDGNYTQGNYDVVLPPGRFSSSTFGWSYTEGFYVGPNYCVEVFRKFNAGDTWEDAGSYRGPIRQNVSRYWYWSINTYPVGNPPLC